MAWMRFAAVVPTCLVDGQPHSVVWQTTGLTLDEADAQRRRLTGSQRRGEKKKLATRPRRVPNKTKDGSNQRHTPRPLQWVVPSPPPRPCNDGDAPLH